MTDELIARLSANLKPVRNRAIERLLFGAVLLSGAASVVVMLSWLGMRHDIQTAPGTAVFWAKFGYTSSLALLGGVTTLVLAKPGGRTRWPWLASAGLLALVLVGAGIQMAGAEPDQTMPLIIGGTSLVCPWRIVVLALPVLIGAFLALRRMAPTNPTFAGFAAGVMAGGTGAGIYSLACAENGLMFLGLWYTLGILMVGGIGALLGRLLLRW